MTNIKPKRNQHDESDTMDKDYIHYLDSSNSGSSDDDDDEINVVKRLRSSSRIAKQTASVSVAPMRLRPRRKAIPKNQEGETQDLHGKKLIKEKARKSINIKAPPKKKLARLFHRNGTFARMKEEELRVLFSHETLTEKLSMEERHNLCKFLPLCDVNHETQAPSSELFWDPIFRESLDQFQSLAAQGLLLPSKNLPKTLQETCESNLENGFDMSRMKEYWIDVAEHISTSWVTDLDNNKQPSTDDNDHDKS